MSNPMINPQPNYSGVTIQITNPTVNTSGVNKCPQNSECVTNPIQTAYVPNYYAEVPQTEVKALPAQEQMQSYPAQYYLNNYNLQNNGKNNDENIAKVLDNLVQKSDNNETSEVGSIPAVYQEPEASNKYEAKPDEPQDFTKSNGIINDLNAREEALKEEKNNSKEKRVVALTDEYIKSLENYLNNPNQEIRLMASKEILTRLDEDKERFDDAALNALLNKMLQDPSKLIRVAALSAFSSQLASGNDYTVQLLNNIQQNPSADKEDVLQAADILLKMSAGTEIKRIPNPTVKEENQQN